MKKVSMYNSKYNYIKEKYDDKAACVTLIQIVLPLTLKPMIVTKIFIRC